MDSRIAILKEDVKGVIPIRVFVIIMYFSHQIPVASTSGIFVIHMDMYAFDCYHSYNWP